MLTTFVLSLVPSVRLQKMLSHTTAWLPAQGLQLRLAIQEICQVAKYSLLWILAILLQGTNGWYFPCHLPLLQC